MRLERGEFSFHSLKQVASELAKKCSKGLPRKGTGMSKSMTMHGTLRNGRMFWLIHVLSSTNTVNHRVVRCSSWYRDAKMRGLASAFQNQQSRLGDTYVQHELRLNLSSVH